MTSKTIVMRRQGINLYPANPAEQDAIEAYPQNVDLNVSIRRARSVRQNNTYWGWLSYMIASGPEWIGKKWPDAQSMSDSLQLDIGYVRIIARLTGEPVALPESKNFEEMSQERFNEYFNACQEVMRGLVPDRDMLAEYLARKRRAA